MFRYLRFFMLAALIGGGLLISSPVFAHEHRDVGEYEFVVGFINEPAFEGEQNGIWVNVTDKETGQPIEGLEDTLTAQVMYGAEHRDLPLQPAFGEQGVYTAVFYPTAAGDYTFRFFGDIEGTPVDESFTSSPEGFDSVQAPAELQFPARVPAPAELSSQLAAAQRTARTALLVGGAGLALGLLGVLGAGVALRRGRSGAARREAAVART